jgi:2-hydroxychromene-2-carboxylate isomerase
LNDYVPPLPLRVVKLDGPFEEKGQKVTVLEKEKWYIYKVVQFNRGAKEYEIKDLKWATKFDNQPLNTGYSNIRRLKEVKFNIDKEFNFTKFVVYAYFEKHIDEVSIESKLKDGKFYYKGTMGAIAKI